MDIGSSYLPSDIIAAFLYAQMEKAEEITKMRFRAWMQYYEGLKTLADQYLIELPFIPEDCVHNAHMFYIKVRDLQERTSLNYYLKENGISSIFHYIPLHSAKAGLFFSKYCGEDIYTTQESEKLTRLPLYAGLDISTVERVVSSIVQFYR